MAAQILLTLNDSKMKKLLLLASGLFFTVGANAQMEVEAVMEKNYNGTTPAVAGTEAVNDTLSAVVLQGCDTSPRTYSGASFGYVSGTNKFGATEMAQVLNLDSLNVDVYGIMAFVTNKEQGANPGNFKGYVYSSTDTLTPDMILGTTNNVSFANLDTVNTWTNFDFATPVSVGAESFFVALEIDNGSDTLSVATTGANCGGGTALLLDQNGWFRIGDVFNASGGGALDPVIYMFAKVENNSIGLDPKMISRSGLDFYPNPATDRAFVEVNMDGENEVEVRIQNMSGATVATSTHTLSGDRIELNLSNLAEGVYTYQVIASKQQLNGVFVKK